MWPWRLWKNRFGSSPFMETQNKIWGRGILVLLGGRQKVWEFCRWTRVAARNSGKFIRFDVVKNIDMDFQTEKALVVGSWWRGPVSPLWANAQGSLWYVEKASRWSCATNNKTWTKRSLRGYWSWANVLFWNLRPSKKRCKAIPYFPMWWNRRWKWRAVRWTATRAWLPSSRVRTSWCPYQSPWVLYQ